MLKKTIKEVKITWNTHPEKEKVVNRTSQTQTASSHPLAIVGLVLGILGLVGVLPLVGSIGAVIAGKMAQKEIFEKPGMYSGDNLARASIVMGWIGIALATIACILILAAFLFFMPVPTRPVPIY